MKPHACIPLASARRAVPLVALLLIACQPQPQTDQAPTGAISPEPMTTPSGEPGAVPEAASAHAPDAIAGWPRDLAAAFVDGTAAVFVLRPHLLLQQLEATRGFLEARGLAGQDELQTLLAQAPPQVLKLMDAAGWSELGFDPQRPIAVLLVPGSRSAWGALREAAQRPPSAAAPPIEVSLTDLGLTVRVALPVADEELALSTLTTPIAALPDVKPAQLDGYTHAYIAEGIPIGLKTIPGYLLADVALTPDKSADAAADAPAFDREAAARGLLASLTSAPPQLTPPRQQDVFHLALGVEHLATLDAFRRQVAPGRELPALTHALTFGGPFRDVTFAIATGEREQVVLRAVFRQPRPELAAALATRSELEPGGLASLTLNSWLAAAGESPWTAAGLGVPEPASLDQLVGDRGMDSLVYWAVPLWLHLVPTLGWSAAPPELRVLRPDDGLTLQLVVEPGFTAADQRLAAVAIDSGHDTSNLARILACLTQAKALTDDCDVSAIVVGSDASATLPNGRTAHYRLQMRGPDAVAIVATQAESLARLAQVPLRPAGDSSRASVARLTTSFAGLAEAGFLPPDPLLSAVLSDVLGAIEVRVDATPDALEYVAEAEAKLPVLALQAAIAIPAFVKYIRLSKEAEARNGLRGLGDGARIYAFGEHLDAGGNAFSGVFPLTSEPACSAGGAPGKTDPRATDWLSDPWSALGYQQTVPHYFRYCYQSFEQGVAFAAWAEADLDDDGVAESRLCLTGRMVDGVAEVTPSRPLAPQDSCVPD